MEAIKLIQEIKNGDRKSLARAISLVENEASGYEMILENLTQHTTPVIGITGPPGAGKSTLTDQLIGFYAAQGKKIAVLCVDPSSPFHLGALLGDRIRMNRWYDNELIYIRSLASRGSLGGLNQKIIEITDVVKAGNFDYIIIETVGIGQSEIEIAGLADVTVVTLVPESGDEVQAMKAGMMEIAQIFVVNKSDRPQANNFVKNLAAVISGKAEDVPIIKCVATKGEGIPELAEAIERFLNVNDQSTERKNTLLLEKAWQLLQQKEMRKYDKEKLFADLLKNIQTENFNIYKFLKTTY